MSHLHHIIVLCVMAAVMMLSSCRGHADRQDRSHLEAVDSLYQQEQSIERMQAIVDSLRRADDQPSLMMALKQLGKLCRNSSRFQDAIDAHNGELDIATQLADTIEVVRALNNLGTNFRRMGILEEATVYHYQALGYCDSYSAKDDPVMIKNRVVSLNGIGNIYMTMGNYAAADTILRAALEGERRLGSELGQAINLANIGSIFEHQGMTDSAWTYYQQSLVLNQLAGSQLGISLCHTHFGQLHERAGNLRQAIQEYTTAYDMMRNSSDSWHWMESCVALARAHIKSGDYAVTQRYVQQVDSIATAVQSLEHQEQVLRLKYEMALRQGNSQRALEYYVQADVLEDSIQHGGNSSQVMNTRLNYERQRRQAEVDLIEQNYQAERTVKNIAIMAAVLIVLLAAIAIAFLLYTLRVRRRGELLRQQLELQRTRFFINVTHEFRTPLTVIMGLSDQLTKSPHLPEAEHQQAGIIHRQGNNLLQLINQLLDISRVRSAIGAPEWRTGNIVPYVGMLIEAYSALAQSKDITVQYAAQVDEIMMDFAPYYIRRIVGNLVSNSLKFTPPGGTVMITCGIDDGDKLLLVVADTGVGIAPNDLPHIFETFYVGEAVTHGDMSTGVGLSLVNQVVRAMDGTIVVHSDVDKGTVFTITLPLRHGDGNWPRLENPSPTESLHGDSEVALDDADGTANDACRILVVEDHNDVAYYIGEQLRDKYQVYYASNGMEAISKAEQLVPDMVITDLMMPEMDGYELCRRIRDNEVLNHIPVIMVTARCTDEDRLQGYEAGADAYLEKPFNPDELRMRVTQLFTIRQQLRRHLLQRMGAEVTQAEAAVAGNEPTMATGSQPESLPQSRIQAITASEQAFVARFVDQVERAMAEHRVDMESIASQLCMTSSQLRRKMQAITGKTSINYANELRMGRAVRLLVDDPDLTISEIADRCGYEEQSYFARQFKQFYGMTPTQYRDKLNH